ncbi:hypothetical protein K440DRAFT_622044 [Wilcoxina mikolae CBS 423.85]|nr:hypothetical protein K440DRAFT_622044 [Wilcoxina mikolae CBS 423.85]
MALSPPSSSSPVPPHAPPPPLTCPSSLHSFYTHTQPRPHAPSNLTENCYCACGFALIYGM